MKRVLIILSICFYFGSTFAQGDKILGIWLSEEKTGKVEVYKRGDKYYGKIIWLSETLDENTGKPLTDINNPNSNLKTRPLKGLVILKDLKYDARDKEWEGGTIYDPKTGNTYSCYMVLRDNNYLKLRGYVGVSLIGRNSYWTRVR